MRAQWSARDLPIPQEAVQQILQVRETLKDHQCFEDPCLSCPCAPCRRLLMPLLSEAVEDCVLECQQKQLEERRQSQLLRSVGGIPISCAVQEQQNSFTVAPITSPAA